MNEKKRFELRISAKRGVVRFAENVVKVLKNLRKKMILKVASKIVRKYGFSKEASIVGRTLSSYTLNPFKRKFLNLRHHYPF